jgi:hypothetical protein
MMMVVVRAERGPANSLSLSEGMGRMEGGGRVLGDQPVSMMIRSQGRGTVRARFEERRRRRSTSVQ